MINLKDLSFQFNHQGPFILRNITLDIRPGEYLAVIGPNGSGKSTLLRHFNGLLLATEGDVLVERQNTKERSQIGSIRQKVGMVFQNPDTQIVGMTVEEDVAFGPVNLGLPPQEIRARVSDALTVVGMEKYAQTPPHNLSSGEKQLIAIAGVLAMNPKYIAFDEPTTFLDPSAKEKILQVMKRLYQEGITIIHVTHDLNEILDADRVVVLNRGRIVFNAKPAELFSKPEVLAELGLHIPGITRFMMALRDNGIKIRPDILNLDDVCRELSFLLTHTAVSDNDNTERKPS